MKLVIQRSMEASVTVDGEIVGQIESGLVILVGIAPADSQAEVNWLADKAANLRIFEDEDGKMNRSLLDVDGEALVISQFTLYGNCRKGRRPSFVAAAHPSIAEPLVNAFVEALHSLGVRKVATGIFGADMKVALINDGPVTLVIEK